jgi:hypothetical protein
MIEVSLTELNRSNFYEKTLQMIEQICDDYAIEKDFGTLSMTNQMVCDYLENNLNSFTVDFYCQIESDGVTFQYALQNGSFELLSQDADGDNTALFVLQSLADEVSFSTGYDTLITTFHVKTKTDIQRQFTQQQVRSHIFKS